MDQFDAGIRPEETLEWCREEMKRLSDQVRNRQPSALENEMWKIATLERLALQEINARLRDKLRDATGNKAQEDPK